MTGGLHQAPGSSSVCGRPVLPAGRPSLPLGAPRARPDGPGAGVSVCTVPTLPPAHALSRQDLQPIAPPDSLCVAEVSLSGVSLSSFQLKTLRVPTPNHGWHLPGAASLAGGEGGPWDSQKGKGETGRSCTEARAGPWPEPRTHCAAPERRGRRGAAPASGKETARFSLRDADTSRRKHRAGERLYPGDKPASWTRCFSRAGWPSSDLSDL